MAQNPIQLGEARVAGLSYRLISGRHSAEEGCALHNAAYRLWHRCWESTFSELKSEAKLNPQDFLRQDIISALYDGQRAVGLLLHTYLNLELDAVREQPYLATYPAEVIDRLREEGVSKVLTMEYLTLDPLWRKSKVGLSMGEVILGLGAKLFAASGFEAMLVVTRNDRGVNQTLYGYGGRCLAAGLTKHNVPVDIVSLDRGKTRPGPNEKVNYWIEYFWGKRQDTVDIAKFSQSVLEQANPARKAG